MEALGFGTILLIVVVAMYYGVIAWIGEAADGINDEIKVLRAERKEVNIQRFNKISVSDEDVESAIAIKNKMAKIQF